MVGQPGSPPPLPPSFQQVPEIQRDPETVRAPEVLRPAESARGPVTLRADRQGPVVIIPREQVEVVPRGPAERPVLRPETSEAGAGPAMPATPMIQMQPLPEVPAPSRPSPTE